MICPQLENIFKLIPDRCFIEADKLLQKALPQNVYADLFVVANRRITLKQILSAGNVDLLRRVYDKGIGHVITGGSFIPGPVGMVFSFIEAVFMLLLGNYPAAGLALLGCIPGFKQIKLLDKFFDAFSQLEFVKKILTNYKEAYVFFSKAKNKCAASFDDLKDFFSNSIKNPFSPYRNSEYLVQMTSTSKLSALEREILMGKQAEKAINDIIPKRTFDTGSDIHFESLDAILEKSIVKNNAGGNYQNGSLLKNTNMKSNNLLGNQISNGVYNKMLFGI